MMSSNSQYKPLHDLHLNPPVDHGKRIKIGVGLLISLVVFGSILYVILAFSNGPTTFSLRVGTRYQDPLYPMDLNLVQGVVDLSFEGPKVQIDYKLIGTDPRCVDGPDEAAANSCGIHIHEGTCADAGGSGPHYYPPDNRMDPWASIVYAMAEGSVTVDYGYNWANTQGRAFVIHDYDGIRMTCDTLEMPTSRSLLLTGSEAEVYPDYPGALRISGQVFMDFQMTNVVISYELTGLDPACFLNGTSGGPNSCGIHIHALKSCADAGPHYFGNSVLEDPWTMPAFYRTRASDIEWPLGLRVEYGYPWSETVGRAFVIHDRSGDKVSCVLLPAS